MKIYLAARYQRRLEMVSVARLFKAAGYEVVSRWVRSGPDGEHDGCSASSDLEDIDRSEALVFFSEGLTPIPSGGRHVEFGYALARRKALLVVGAPENIFHLLPGIWNVPDVSAAIEVLATIPRKVSGIDFPVVGNPDSTTWEIPELLAVEHKAAFPGVDVFGEYRRARAWIMADLKNRKTARGMPRFLFGWLSRAQNQRTANAGPARAAYSDEEKRAAAARRRADDAAKKAEEERIRRSWDQAR